jgi:hypothetical protein
MAMFDIIGSSSTQSVVDIRELQFENCLDSNNRKEVFLYQKKFSFSVFFFDYRSGKQSIMINQ